MTVRYGKILHFVQNDSPAFDKEPLPKVRMRSGWRFRILEWLVIGCVKHLLTHAGDQ